MKKIVFIAMYLIPFFCFSQEKESMRRLTSIGIVFSPNYSYRKLNYASSNQWIADIRDEEEIPKTGFSAGIGIRYRLRNDLMLETGLSYSNRGIRTKSTSLVWSADDPDFPAKARTYYHYKYIELPLMINYRFFKTDKLDLFVRAGLSFNLFLARKTKVVMEFSGKSDDTHASSKYIGYTKLNTDAKLGVGADYRISKKFTVRMEPAFQRSITSITGDRDAKEFLYSFAINTGVYMNLGRKSNKRDREDKL